MKAAFHTLGCKVNQYDTEAMLEAFENDGWEIASFDDDCDMYLINTCTVTGTGDQKSMKLMRKIAREHPDAGIIAAGCLAQRESEMLLSMDNVKLVIGVQRRAEVVSLYRKALEEDIKINAVYPLRGASFESLFVTRHEGKTRATMKIQEGCDRYCAYCVIPYVRGPIRSMPIIDIRSEANRLAEAGYKEIVVTGIHLASYEKAGDASLIEAIRAVSDTGVRVRLGSIEPVIATREFSRELSQIPNLMRQFHLSLQSGSESVLKRMRRRYSPDEYMESLSNIRRFMPDSAITTDVLTGFPGETDEEATETLDFVDKARFARLHVFPYSRRSGTIADKMDNQVSEETKKERVKELISKGNKLEDMFVKGLYGTVQTVLFEQTLSGMSEGYTQHYIRVRGKAEAGSIENMLITGFDGLTALGEKYSPDRR